MNSNIQKVSKVTLLIATLLGAATFITSDSTAASRHTGIEGQTMLVTTFAPTRQAPVATTFNVLTARNRRQLMTVETDANGLFSLNLHPGTGNILDLSPGCSVLALPFEVTVKSRQFTPANIFYVQEVPCTVSQP